MALRVITASDRMERGAFGLGAKKKTQPVIDTIPWPQRSLPFNESSERPTQQAGGGPRWQQGGGRPGGCIYVCSGYLCSRLHMYRCSCADEQPRLWPHVADFHQGLQPHSNIPSLLGRVVWRKWVESGSKAFLEEFKSVWGLWLLHPVKSLQRELYASP